MDWSEYLENTKNRKPTPLLIAALSEIPRNGVALDIGIGAGVDTRAIAAHGLIVDAVDPSPEVVAYIPAHSDGLPIHVFQTGIENFSIIENQYDLIFAWYSLPFIKNEEKYMTVLERIRSGLKNEGHFLASVFGEDEPYVKESGLTRIKKEKLVEIFKDFEIKTIKEIKDTHADAAGNIKDWHRIVIHARKP